MQERSTAALAPLTRAERRRLATRTSLLDAARALFAERGLHETSIAAIAERADVGLGTFYLHFADKDDLLAAILADDEERIARRIAQETSTITSPLARHRAGTRIYLEYAFERRYLFPILFDTIPAAHPVLRAVRQRWVEGVAQLLREAMAAGEITPGEPLLLARLLVAMVGQAALWWRDHEAPPPAEVARIVSDLIEHGLQVAPRRQEANQQEREERGGEA
jgi:AcrR family transcriptional regulator